MCNLTENAMKMKKRIKKRPAAILSDKLRTLDVVGVTGLEPAASWSRTKRSTKLSHTPIFVCGGRQKPHTITMLRKYTTDFIFCQDFF